MNYFIFISQEKNKGFSLIELVVVVAVLSVLSAIAIPSFNCFLKKSKATAALVALKQIKTECISKESEAKPAIFSSSALGGYTIQTSESNSCAGSNGVISAVPVNTNELPSFYLNSVTKSLTYKFKGMEGTNLSGCLGLICGNGIFSNNDKKKYNIHEFVIKDAVISSDDGCSDYVIVNADSWEEAESNAQKLGGNLITLNSQGEYNWIQQNLTNDNTLLKDAGHEANDTTTLSMYFVGLNDKNEEGKYEWSSGEQSEWSGNNNEQLIHRQNWLAQQHHANSHDHFVMLTNDCGFTDCQNEDYRPDLYTGRGVGTLVWVDNESTFYKGWNSPHFGIAEIPNCKS